MADFVPGLYFKKLHPNAPHFVKAKGSIKVQAMLDYLTEAAAKGEEWVNFECRENKAGDKVSAFVDDWKPSQQPAQRPADDFDDDRLPF